MIDVVSAKNRILQMAIRGDLSEHKGNLNDVETVVCNIEHERKDLIKRKETKECKTAPMIQEGLFDIPDSWIWVPLGSLCVLLSRGKSPTYSEKKLYPVFAQKCNQPNALALEKALFLDETTLDKWPEYFRLRDGDVVINSTGTGTMGRVGYYESITLNSNYPFMVPDSHVTVARVGSGIVSKYIYYALRSTTLQNIMEKQFRGSTNQKEFYIDAVYAMPIPLPPTEEQSDIVDTLDAAFVLIDKIAESQESYLCNLDVLRGKIIDAGVQGLLTDQLPTDGTAAELYDLIQDEKSRQEKLGEIKKTKPIPELDDDDRPFDIPDNWMWTRFGHTSYIVRGGSPRPIKQYITESEDGINWIKIGDVEKGGKYIYSTKEKILPSGEKKSRRVYPGDFLLTNSMSFGRPYISKIEGCIHDGWLLIRNMGGFDSNYLYYLLSSTYLYNQFTQKASGSTVDNLNIDKVNSAIIPLPPIAEQKRIAERIDELIEALPQ